MTELPATRQSLLIELGKRSDLAWSEFLDVYEGAIIRYCASRGLQEADARDAAQAVYAAIQKKMASWDHDSNRGSFRAWLFRVARNVSVDLLVAKSRSAVSGDSVTREKLSQVRDHRSTGNHSVDDQHSTAFRLELQRALFEWASSQIRDEVRDTTWQAFSLTAIQGMKAEDAAEKLGTTVGNVYTGKCRVMARIRAKVAEWDDELDHPTPSDEPTK